MTQVQDRSGQEALGWHGLARRIQRALDERDEGALEAALAAVRTTRQPLERTLAETTKAAGQDQLNTVFRAVRSDLFAMLAPVSAAAAKALLDRVQTQLVRTGDHGAYLAPEIGADFDRRGLTTTRDRIGVLWREVLPAHTAPATVSAWNGLREAIPTGRLQEEIQASLDLINRIEREYRGTQSCADTVLVEVNRQLQSGLTFARKLIEVAPRVYARSGVSVTTQRLASLVQRSAFPLNLALAGGVTTAAMDRVLSGCTPDCYPAAGQPLNPDGPHAAALGYPATRSTSSRSPTPRKAGGTSAS
jgi:hypothetical protein